MKILRYVLGASMLIFAVDMFIPISTNSLYACPRCRRALPKGPKKLPHRAFPSRHNTQQSTNMSSQLTNTCSPSCCCIQQKNSSSRLTQKKQEESLNG